MGWLDAIPIIGKIFGDTTDIIKEAVTDKDKQNEILGNLQQGQQKLNEILYLAELQTKTIPWVDGLHKMGRQILAMSSIVATVTLLLFDITITPAIALIIGGPTTAYTLIKKQGK